MYKNKSKIKSTKMIEDVKKLKSIKTPIPEERKRLLDAFFGALYTVADGGYIFLNDMRYDLEQVHPS